MFSDEINRNCDSRYRNEDNQSLMVWTRPKREWNERKMKSGHSFLLIQKNPSKMIFKFDIVFRWVTSSSSSNKSLVRCQIKASQCLSRCSSVHTCAPIDRVHTWSNKPCEVFLFSVLSHWWNTNPCYSFSLTHSRSFTLFLSHLWLAISTHDFCFWQLLHPMPANLPTTWNFVLSCSCVDNALLQASEIHNSIARTKKNSRVYLIWCIHQTFFHFFHALSTDDLRLRICHIELDWWCLCISFL